jgi:hypothetical protein
MTAIELSEEFRDGRARYDFMGTLLAGWRAMRRHRQRRREIVAISRHGPRLIRDMGFDPEEVYKVLDGSWDEVDPARLRSHFPRRERI